MVALVGAMFVAMQSVSAAECGVASPTTLKLAGADGTPAAGTCEISLPDVAGSWAYKTDSNVETTGDGLVTLSAISSDVVTVTAAAAGDVKISFIVTTGTPAIERTITRSFSVVPYSETVATTERSVTLEIDDSDDTVTNVATLSYGFTITTKNIPALPAGAFTVYVSGELDNATVDVQAPTEDADLTTDVEELTYTGSIVVPQGTTIGEYTLSTSIYRVSTVENGTETLKASTMPVSATADQIEAETTVVSKPYSGSDVLIVGDAGANVADASLELAPLDKDRNPSGATTSVSTQRPTAVAGDPGRDGSVFLILKSLNSNGSLSNASGNLTVTVTASGAAISAHSVNAKLVDNTTDTNKTDEPNSTRLEGQNEATFILEITKSRPGMVEVSAIVVDTHGSGYAVSDSIPLTFSGPVETISLGEASSTLHKVATDDGAANDTSDDDNRDVIRFALSAVDKAGNATGAERVTIQITDPDGVNVAPARIGRTQGANSVGHPNAQITLTSMGTAAAPLDSGTYKIKVIQTSKITDEATFTVVGVADSVELDVSEMAPNEVGQQVQVTATVNDADGNPVANGTPVTFRANDQTADDDAVLVLVGAGGERETKGGVAKATFVTVGGGTATVTAVAGSQTGVAVVISTAGVVEPEAMPEEEASVSCLSELSGFATWSCGVETDASEIFDMVSGRGVTAIHLWNGSTWVRYSVVDGAMVPGSSDFMVTKSDILYISN